MAPVSGQSCAASERNFAVFAMSMARSNRNAGVIQLNMLMGGTGEERARRTRIAGIVNRQYSVEFARMGVPGKRGDSVAHLRRRWHSDSGKRCVHERR